MRGHDIIVHSDVCARCEVTGVEKSEVKRKKKGLRLPSTCAREEKLDDVLSDFLNDLEMRMGLAPTSSGKNFLYCRLDHINPSSLVFY